MSDTLVPLLVFLAIAVVLFLILREINMWYWKINERIAMQNQTNILLEKILSQLKKTGGSGVYSSTDDTNEGEPHTQSEDADTQTVDRETLNNENIRIISVNNETIGAKVLINGQRFSK